MINHVRPRMACTSAILIVALAHCGCQSMKGPSSWMASSKPRSNEKETIRYIGQKDKSKPSADELRTKLANASKDGPKSSSSFDTYLRNGNQALRNNQLAEAKKEYEKALALKPNDPDCHHRLAVVADKEGMFGVADDHYQAALKQRPNDANLLSDMGYSYSLRHEDRLAEDVLNRALKTSPTHKGAMANLGAIYARQNRYEDAMAMFSRGASEAEAQQYMAQLFPQRGGPTSGAAPDNRMLAQNNPDSRSAPQNTDQLREAMLRARAESKAQRQQQIDDEARPRREWYAQDQQNARAYQQPPAQSNQPIVLGPNSGQQPSPFNQGNPNQFPVVTPNSGNGNSMASNDGIGQNPNGAAVAGSLNARPGTTPDINEWGGAGVSDPNFQRASGQRTANAGQLNAGPHYSDSSTVNNVPYYPNSANGGGQFNSRPPASIQLPNNLQASGGSDVSPASYNDASAANQAAAQMGMNIGGLFPVVPADAGGGSFGQPNQSAPRVESRFATEFPSAPSYQNPNQFQPSNNGFGAGDQRQGFNQPANQFDGQLGPASPASGWGQNQNQVTQAGAVMPNNPSVPSFGGDPMDRTPTASTWADKPNLGGAAPYNGTWPQGAAGGAAANPSRANNIPNSLPNWNGGQTTRPQPKQIGPAASANDPEPWPYRTQ